jgi:hypothetical protein
MILLSILSNGHHLQNPHFCCLVFYIQTIYSSTYCSITGIEGNFPLACFKVQFLLWFVDMADEITL